MKHIKVKIKNRQKLKNTLSNKEYKIINRNLHIPYLDEGVYFKDRFNNITSNKFREFKTWKYNRKKQYK